MLKEYLSNIANAIRSKLGTTEKINAQDFASKILSISTGSGGESDFWEIYQNEGKRTDYAGAFAGSGWTAETFTPKYNMKPTNANSMFYYAKNIKKLTQLLNDAGVVLDTSECTSFNNMFLSADALTHVPTISTVSCEASSQAPISKLFNWNTLLVEIEKVIFKNDGSQVLSGCFEGLNALKKIVIEGKIGSNVNMKYSSNLETASVVSIVESLYEGASGKTLTLSKTLVETKLVFPHTSAQSGITYNSWAELKDSKSNWTISTV